MVKINKLYILYRIDYVFNKNEDILLVQRIKLIVNTMIRRKKIILGRVMKAIAKQSKIEIFVTGGNIQDTFQFSQNWMPQQIHRKVRTCNAHRNSRATVL